MIILSMPKGHIYLLLTKLSQFAADKDK